jgi:hypothetical protein
MQDVIKYTNIEDIRKGIFAGNATITIQSDLNKKWFTFKIKTSKKIKNSPYFVSVLSGTNNDSDFTYIGTIRDKTVHLTQKSKVTEKAESFRWFKYFIECVNSGKIPETMLVYHSTHCSRCGKLLTTPESISTGIGPECSKLI